MPKKTKMKRGEEKAVKAIEAHPEAVLGAIPQGFVLIRLHSEIKQVLDELKATRRIGEAIDALKQRPEYANLDKDIIAVLRGEEPGPAEIGIDRSESEERLADLPAPDLSRGFLGRLFG